MFNIEDYRAFIKSKVQRSVHRKDAIPIDKIIDFCCQWDKTPADFFNISTVQANRQLKIALDAASKPTRVPYNTYFLYLFGFLKCRTCSNILCLDKFNTDTVRWYKLDDRCSDCASARTAIWRANNPGKAASQRANRRACEHNSTPKWLTDKQKADILHFYVESWQLGLEVDHIVPLQGDNVCGLHVPWNLQLLDRTANAAKGNKFAKWADIE